MTDFAARVEAVSISGIRKVFEAAGSDAINLGLGQPDFPTPEHVSAAAIEAIEEHAVDGYTTNKGIESLREAIVRKHARDNDIEADPEQVIATAGASEALHLAMQAHVDPGDEVIIPDPGFVSYEALTNIAGGTPVPVGLEDDLRLAPEAVEAAITDDTAAFIVNSPANPTGAVQTEADMAAFGAIADKYDVCCISDEVYEHIVFDGAHYSPYPMAASDNVIVVNACSKSYSMTGWRLGWVLASEDRIERMLRVHQYAQACASAPAQYAAKAALEGPQDPIEEMREAFATRRDVLLEGLEAIGLETPTPRGAFYAMPSVPDGFVDAVLERGVVIVPGTAFGERGAGTARISYATDIESIEEALEIMGEAYEAVT